MVLKLEKKGDYRIKCAEFYSGKYIAFSDCKDTQIFCYDNENLQIQKLTKKIAHTNSIPQLPACCYIKGFKDDNGADKIFMVSQE